MNDARLFLAIGAAAGFLTVLLGAFGAHGLRGVISPGLFEAYQTGILYQGLHALALLVTGLLMERDPHIGLRWAGWAFATGILLFSGSLYLMAAVDIRGLGMITPFGGLAFLLGWGLLLRGLLRN